MNKITITDLAKEFDLDAKEFLSKLVEVGYDISPKARTITEKEAEEIRSRWKVKSVSLTETRKGDVLEKRVKTSVIRRRKVAVQEPAVSSKELTLQEVSKREPELKIPPKISSKITETPSTASPKISKESSVSISKVKVVEPHPVKASSPTKPTAVVQVPTVKKGEEKKKEELEKELVVLAEKRKTAFIKKRSQEFDLTDFRKIERIYQPKRKKILDRTKMKPTPLTMPKSAKRIIKIVEKISVSELAENLKLKVTDVIKTLMKYGMATTPEQTIDTDTATLVATEHGYEIKAELITAELLLKREEPQLQDLKPRSPVVTVMGHVDHGKTTLLDTIRHTHVAAGEAGGITQHMGAYMVNVSKDRIITFIDTPGHEAFSAMRARGAKTTDIVILVVAADDGVMPQTKEAAIHAKEAGVPIVVAINKIDKPGVQTEKIKRDLSEIELVPEEWGGKTIIVEISAKNNQGIKELLEVLLLQADVLELKASANIPAQGAILEAKLEKGLGPVATVLVQQGTLRRGDFVVAGTIFGKVRFMQNDRKEQLMEAGPSFAVEISGLEKVPEAGELFYAFKDETSARALVEWRLNKEKADKMVPIEKMTLEGLYEKMKESSLNELKFVVKVDVQGSLEVVRQTIEKLSSEKIKMNVIYASTGAISESDVNLAYASNAILVGFNIRPDHKANEVVKSRKVDVRLYTIIYELEENLKKAMEGQLEPVLKEVVIGQAEVRNVFAVSKVGTVAGCMVIDGKITRTAQLRLLRDHKVIYVGKIASLKRFKNDAKEVLKDYECGISIENYNDIKAGDIIEAFVVESVTQTA